MHERGEVVKIPKMPGCGSLMPSGLTTGAVPVRRGGRGRCDLVVIIADVLSHFMVLSGFCLQSAAYNHDAIVLDCVVMPQAALAHWITSPLYHSCIVRARCEESTYSV